MTVNPTPAEMEELAMISSTGSPVPVLPAPTGSCVKSTLMNAMMVPVTTTEYVWTVLEGSNVNADLDILDLGVREISTNVCPNPATSMELQIVVN